MKEKFNEKTNWGGLFGMCVGAGATSAIGSPYLLPIFLIIGYGVFGNSITINKKEPKLKIEK